MRLFASTIRQNESIFEGNKAFYNTSGGIVDKLRGDKEWQIEINFKSTLIRDEIVNVNQLLQVTSGSNRRWTLIIDNDEGGKYLYFTDLFTSTYLRSSAEINEEFNDVVITASASVITMTVNGVSAISSIQNGGATVNSRHFTVGGNVNSGLQTLTEAFTGDITLVRVFTESPLALFAEYNRVGDSLINNFGSFPLTEITI